MRMRRPLLRMIAAVAVAVAALFWALHARSGPSDGTVVLPGSQFWHDESLVVSQTYGENNPLRAGDIVTAVDGRPLTTGGLDRRLRPGDVVVYDIVRDGVPLRVPVTLVRYPARAIVAAHLYALPYVAFMVLLPSLLIARRPRDPAAVTLYAVGVLQFVGYNSYPFGTQVIDVASGRLWISVLAETVNCLLWASLAHFAVAFPQTWPVLRRRPWLVAAGYALPFVAYAVTLVVWLPGAQGLRRTWLLISVATPASHLFPVLVLAGMVGSYVLARDRFARQRMRWVTYALALLMGGYLVLGRLPELFAGATLIGWGLLALVWVPAQLLLAAAVLRYRLFDIQVILRRSLVYGLVTLGLVVVYVGVAALIEELVGARLGPASVLVAVVVALSFAATRRALRRVVSRLVYGEREDPYEVLRQLGERLESSRSPEAVLSQLVTTLVRTLRLAHASIEVIGLGARSAGQSRPGAPGPTAATIDLTHDGSPVGRLVLDPGPNREPFGASDRRLLDGLTRQLSATAHELLLDGRLRRSLESRVTMLEEERRRIRREIHDGLGTTLASASMRLELGRSLIRTDPAAAERILTDLAEVHAAVFADVRQLVDGLRPTVLDHLGLEAGLRELVDQLAGPVRTTLACGQLDALPAAVEVAVYRIVSEALTNVVRHARATACEIQVTRSSTAVVVQVADDGRGLPAAHRPGMGLTSMRERCAELGGSASVSSAAAGGTVVRCELPLRHEQVVRLGR